MSPSNGADAAAMAWTFELHPVDIAAAETHLKEAKRILDAKGIVFFLRQGTCLGAVRDGALIPWDDDMDLGSVVGLHGLTKEEVDPAIEAFRAAGFFCVVDRNDYGIHASFVKSFVRIDWSCYWILGDSILQYPGIQIPLRMFTQLQQIEFLGDKFLVPGPPEDYLRAKYGEEWMVPKPVGYERDVLDMIPEAPAPGRAGKLKQNLARRLMPWRATRIMVLNHDGQPATGATVVVAGLGVTRVRRKGMASLYLPRDDFYAVVVRWAGHEEILYLERLRPGPTYVYRPDAAVSEGRTGVLLST